MKNNKDKSATNKGINILKIIWQKPLLTILWLLCVVIDVTLTIVIIMLDAKALEALTLGDYQSLLKYGIYLIVFALIMATKKILQILLDTKIRLHTFGIVESKIGERMVKITNEVYESLSAGSISSRVDHSPRQLYNAIIMLVQIVSQLIYDSFVVIYMMCLNYIIGLILLGIIIVVLVFRLCINSKSEKLMRVANDDFDKMYGRALETVRGHKDIKCLNLDNEITKDMNKHISKYAKSQRKSENWWIVVDGLFDIVLAVMLAGLMYYGIILYEQYYITYFALIYMLNNYKQVDAVAYDLLQLFTGKNRASVHGRRINQLFNDELMPIETFGTQHLQNYSGQLEFKNVSFVYNDLDLKNRLKADMDKGKHKKKKSKQVEQENNDKTPPKKVLDNFSLKINAGEKVAFVGKSGCGKSTLVSLLSRSLVQSEGQILLDGVEIGELDKESIRGNITVVNQFPYIYYLSLKENLRMVKPDATDEEIANEKKKACLTEFITELPYGMDTLLGEDGVKLSGGQKQRVAIARAFLRDTQVVVFDESTSSLDNFAQKRVQESIDSIKGKTVIVVAHRLSTILNCDRIVFIKNGKVEAQGKFKELMKNCPDFAELYTVRR